MNEKITSLGINVLTDRTLEFVLPDGSTKLSAAVFYAENSKDNGIKICYLANNSVLYYVDIHNITLNGATYSNIQAAVAALNAVIGVAFRGAGGTANQPDMSNYYDKTEVDNALDGKQSTLVSGTNIKTISGNSLLGSGNINIASVRLSAILNNSANQVIPASFLQPDALGNAPKSIFPVVKCKEPNGTFFPVYDQTIVVDNDTIKFIWKIYTNWTGWFDVKTWFRFCVTYDGANLRIIPRNDYGAGGDLEYGNCFFQNWTNDSNPDSNWQDNPSIDAVFEFYLGTIV
jgi:hypothetical protein